MSELRGISISVVLEWFAKSCSRVGVAVATLGVFVPVLAYEYPLSPESIREAYFCASRHDVKTADLIGQYAHTFPVPERGPHIAVIQLQTPFAQIVHRVQQVTNYTAQDATQEFLDKPAVLRVLVKIYFTPSYNAVLGSKDGKTLMRTDDFWREFRIRVIQGSEIDPDRVTGDVMYATPQKGMRRLAGAEIEADYAAGRIRSEPATIEVVSSDGAEVTTTFDLSRLR